MSNPRLNLLVCLFNEELVIDEFVRRIRHELNELAGGVDRARRPLPDEIVFVDDGSTDASVQLAKRYARDDYRIKLVQLAHNYGKEAAVTAAIEHAEGDLMLMMDPDLQDPPEHILDFVATMGFTCWSALSSSAISCSAGPL